MKHIQTIRHRGIVLAVVVATLWGLLFFTQSSVQASVGTIAVSPTVSSEHQRPLDRARDDATSELEIKALECGEISFVELENEATRTTYTACMSDVGHEVIITPSQSVPGVVTLTHESKSPSSEEGTNTINLRTASREYETGTIHIYPKVCTSQIFNRSGDGQIVVTLECAAESNNKDGKHILVTNELESTRLSSSTAHTGKIIVVDGTSCLDQPSTIELAPNTATSTSGRMNLIEITEENQPNPDSVAVSSPLAPKSEGTGIVTVRNECAVSTPLTIETIYGDQTVNPDDVEVMALTVNCLETTGVIQVEGPQASGLTTVLKQETSALSLGMSDNQVL
ncbi:MAG: hypothetical protein M9909_03815 [Thermomicrobiales bacterium]|nr:hypothetical protein [Thermomicrobiales bacterium]